MLNPNQFKRVAATVTAAAAVGGGGLLGATPAHAAPADHSVSAKPSGGVAFGHANMDDRSYSHTGRPTDAPVYYADMTQGRFGNAVTKAAKDWSKSPWVRMQQVTSCETHAPCVTVNAVDDFTTKDGREGEMDPADPSHPVIGLHTRNSIGGSDDTGSGYRRGLACHEFGHALGLDHSNHQGCMHEELYAGGVPEQRHPGKWNLKHARSYGGALWNPSGVSPQSP